MNLFIFFRENFISKYFVFFSGAIFLFSLLLINSNILFLSITCLYLIILIIKLQNYRLALFFVFFVILPFTIGRNLLEIVLIDKKEIYGYSLFDVKYFFPLYLSDAFLLLIYQNYFSKKLTGKQKNIRLSVSFKLALISLSLFILLTAIRSLGNEFGQLTILSSILLIKFLLIFSLPILIDFRKHKEKVCQLIAASVFFQTVLILFEQIKGGNIGKFIESTLPGFETGTVSSEAFDILRANGTFNEANAAAVFLLINICIILPVGLKSFWKKKQIGGFIYLITVLMSLAAIVFTGSRSLYFLTLLVVLFYFFQYKKELFKLSGMLIKNNIFKIILIVGLIVVFPYFVSRVSSMGNVLSEKGSFSYRKELNRHVMLLSENNILGIGLDLTPYYLAKNFKTIGSSPVIFDQAPAHNIFVQLIAETGIIGLISFLLFIYFALKKTIVVRKPRKLINPFAIASLVYLLAAQFHPIFTTHPEILAFFFLYLGMANSIKFEQ